MSFETQKQSACCIVCLLKSTVFSPLVSQHHLLCLLYSLPAASEAARQRQPEDDFGVSLRISPSGQNLSLLLMLSLKSSVLCRQASCPAEWTFPLGLELNSHLHHEVTPEGVVYGHLHFLYNEDAHLK